MYGLLSDSAIRVQFWGSFFAAIFALITFAMTRIFVGIRERNRNHYNFLVKMEAKLNQHVLLTYQAIYIIEGLRETALAGNVSFNNLDALPVKPVGDFYDLQDIDLINSLFSYDAGLESLNADVCNINALYSEIRSALLSNQINHKDFQTRLSILPDNLASLIGAWEEQLELNIDLLTQTRLMIKRDKKKLLGINWLFPRRMKPLTVNAVKAEKLKLQQEIEEIRRLSAERIAKRTK
ncbi:hypothetical protein CVV43_04785 [Candidatus Saccharibacteria bacterium HGW-Saccharibacteria-1]|jgi:hypothetical protein|nr:MAG: hypothetical protein CVV43_04785 [Candidatus Saccharibacteria bacterium HGW-Saccharibacteria-1]